MRYEKDRQKTDELLKKYQLEACFSQLAKYQPYFSIFKAARRERIFGDAARRQEIYILLSGRVKVCTTISNGKQLLLDYYEKTELFGEYILSDEPLNDMNFFYTEALTEVIGLALYVTPVKEQLLNDVKFLHFYIHCLQRRFNQLGIVQSMNVLNSSERNVAGYIWSKYSRSRQKEDFCFHENLREVAERLGISYRHLHRVLHKLIDQEILRRTDRGYFVADEKALYRIIEFE